MKLKAIRRILPSFAGIAVLPVIAGTLFVAWSCITYGDVQSGWMWLNGYRLIAEQYELDLGAVQAGETKTATFRLKNLSNKPVVILGAETDCSCVRPNKLPLTIEPKETSDFEVNFAADKVDSEVGMTRQMILNVNVDQPIMALQLKATIIPSKKGETK